MRARYQADENMPIICKFLCKFELADIAMIGLN